MTVARQWLPGKFELLVAALEAAVAGREADSRRSLGALREVLDAEQVPEDMEYLLFSSALSRRLGDRCDAINLYLQRFEQPQIDLYNLLAQRLPYVAMAGAIANELLSRFLQGQEEVTLLDVGLGTGRQLVTLLQSLAAAGTLPRRLTVVGIEPNADSLQRAEGALGAQAQRLGLELRFEAVPRVVEDVSRDEWVRIRQSPGPLLINASFAMHHIAERPGGEDARERVFQTLRQLEPTAVVLAEPSADHHRVPLRERFHHCWSHFSLAFQLLEELKVTRQERNALKLFFRREIEDIVGTTDDTRRFERHERAEAWVSRLVRSGFEPADLLSRVRTSPHPAVGIRHHHGYVGLEYRSVEMAAVICATPGRF